MKFYRISFNGNDSIFTNSKDFTRQYLYGEDKDAILKSHGAGQGFWDDEDDIEELDLTEAEEHLEYDLGFIWDENGYDGPGYYHGGVAASESLEDLIAYLRQNYGKDWFKFAKNHNAKVTVFEGEDWGELPAEDGRIVDPHKVIEVFDIEVLTNGE